MELKESERLVIAKPVASRPNCSRFRSFSDLLAGAITLSSCSSITAAIKPRTIRFKPPVSSEDHCPVANTEYFRTKNVIFKPMARKPSLPVLLNPMVSENLIKNQQVGNIEIPKLQKKNYLQVEQCNKKVAENLREEEKRFVACPSDNDDGYNWRKYGQKKVKGSEYPRSYYKCTHPNCPVKKKVEQTLDGQIAEIVYKGEHNHSKHSLLKRNYVVYGGNESSSSDRSQFVQNIDESMITEYNKLSTNSSNSGQGTRFLSPITAGVLSTPGHVNNFIDSINGEPKRKARKNEHQLNEKSKEIIGTNIVVGEYQTTIDSDITRDGFRWRKYGQKIVKGNSYPRSYYKCTNQMCNVRKYVERTSEDPNAFITTYEGKHNHEMPVKNMHPPMVNPNTNLI